MFRSGVGFAVVLTVVMGLPRPMGNRRWFLLLQISYDTQQLAHRSSVGPSILIGFAAISMG